MERNISMRRIAIVFALTWILLTLYPRPTMLGQSLYRVFNPPVDADAVQQLVLGLPDFDSPDQLEQHLLDQVPYQYDWQTYNLPWYFPSLEEAVLKGAGDCKTRLIILASTFEALTIPYELHTSPVHIWISYPGKIESSIENEAAAMYVLDGERVRFQLPQIDWAHGAEVFWKAFWTAMPLDRKIALLLGLGYSTALFFQPQPYDQPSRKPTALAVG